MPKMRGFKPELWTDSAVMRLSIAARVLWIGSWNYCCDHGHVKDDPFELKMRVLPADNEDGNALVAEIVEQGLYLREHGYLTVPNFTKHQKIDKRFELTCDHPGCSPSAQRAHDEDTPSTRRVPDENTTGARGVHAGSHDEGEGEGEVKVKGVRGTRRRSATAAPAKLELSEAEKKWAAETCPDVDVAEATEEFLTWAKSVDKRYADWLAAWRNAMKRRQSWHNERAAAQPVKDTRPDWMLA